MKPPTAHHARHPNYPDERGRGVPHPDELSADTRASMDKAWRGARQGHQLGPQLLREACDERDAARAEVERLKAELAEASPYQEMWEAATRELGALSSKTETVRVMWKERAEDAESILAAIRAELGAHEQEEGLDLLATLEGIRSALEGDAPQEDTSTRGDYGGELREEHEDAPQEATEADDETCDHCAMPGGKHSYMPTTYDEVPEMCPLASKHPRYPCSPACTHDDAAPPGHPERVKERNEAAKEAIEAAESLAAGERGLQRAYDSGAEAMRAACLEAVRQRLQVDGSMDVYEIVKAAIEGATP